LIKTMYKLIIAISLLCSFSLIKATESRAATYEEVYNTGYFAGNQLAKNDGYYKGDFYIESTCTEFVTKVIGDTPTSLLGKAFISGCQDGYKKFFGK
jgi:hypothetical protein